MKDIKFDLVYVTYNSSKWVDACFKSLVSCNYNLKNISIYVVDNASNDDTILKLNNIKNDSGTLFNIFEIIKSDKNLGFGKANNLGFSYGNSNIVCFFNIDTEIYADTLTNLASYINDSNDEFVLWELRQFPYEHPKIYNPVTLETTWSSGAAFAIKREAFAKVKGFDDGIFMYAEDVDLSWRIRSFGYKLKYAPKAVIKHYSYESAGQVKPLQYTNSVVNNLLLRYRFGTFKDISIWLLGFIRCFLVPSQFKGAKRLLLKTYFKHFSKIAHFKHGGVVGPKVKEVSKFIGFDYETIRDGAFYYNEFPNKSPKVSIIVRTCGRPAVLRETLISIRNQTYNNIETVVVEDGKEVSKKMIDKEFFDMNIVYKATGKKVGRSKAGNLAMSLASGEYLNFLDDDDLFYADHVEVLVNNIIKNKISAAYATGFATPIVIKSKDPYIYELKNYLGVHKQAFNRIILCHHNYIPIECIMFSKKLFEKYGGLDETADALEDWDLWVRYSMHTDFYFVFKTTSLYRIPAENKINATRQKALDDAYKYMRGKQKQYKKTLSAYELGNYYQ